MDKFDKLFDEIVNEHNMENDEIEYLRHGKDIFIELLNEMVHSGLYNDEEIKKAKRLVNESLETIDDLIEIKQDDMPEEIEMVLVFMGMQFIEKRLAELGQLVMER